MALIYMNATFAELLGLLPDIRGKAEFAYWDEQTKHKLAPYIVTLNGKRIKAYGDLSFQNGQKSLDYDPTYGDIISLKGKERPKVTTVKYLIEYDHDFDNIDDMRSQVADLEKAKKDRTPVSYAVSEIGVEFDATIENLNVTYRGVRDIYVTLDLMEVNTKENQ